MKYIINADDFGISEKFDKAILDLIERNCLFSISVIIRPELEYEMIKKLLPYKDKISLGLHFEYIQKNKKNDKYEKIKSELISQYNTFIEICKQKPSHLDKHNRERSENETRVMCDFSIEKNIPVRLYTRGKFYHIYEKEYKGKIKTTDYLYNLGSNKYGVEKIKEDIRGGKNRNGIYEIICHPGFFDEDYDVQKNGIRLNRKREQDYKNVLEISAFFKENNISVDSFLNFQKEKIQKKILNHFPLITPMKSLK